MHYTSAGTQTEAFTGKSRWLDGDDANGYYYHDRHQLTIEDNTMINAARSDLRSRP